MERNKLIQKPPKPMTKSGRPIPNIPPWERGQLFNSKAYPLGIQKFEKQKTTLNLRSIRLVG